MTPPIKLKIAITLIWGIFSLIFTLAGSETMGSSLKILAAILMFNLPPLAYWLGAWVWGDGYIARAVAPGPRFHRANLEPEHPWYRLFARTLDVLTCAFFIGIATVVFKHTFNINTANIENNFITSMMALLTLTVIEPFLIQTFGTTPGKWAYGIRVENAKNPKQGISLATAFERSFQVYTVGYFCGLPWIYLATIAKGFYDLYTKKQTYWDASTKTRIRYSGIRWGALIPMWIFFTILITIGLTAK